MAPGSVPPLAVRSGMTIQGEGPPTALMSLSRVVIPDAGPARQGIRDPRSDGRSAARR